MNWTHDECYSAIKAKDARFDGLFFTAVTSTGIYCRPVCPARTPVSTNVRFFPTAAAAGAAGFRPCLRCRPEVAPMQRGAMFSDELAVQAHQKLQTGYLDDDSAETLADSLHVTSRHLRRVYSEHFGSSLIEAAQTRRLHLAKQLLQDTDMPITNVAMAAGFGSLRRFNTLLNERWGMSPSSFRKLANQNRGQTSSHIVLRLDYRPPFNWSQVLGFMEMRTIPKVESVSGDVYRRAVRFGERSGIIEVHPDQDSSKRHCVNLHVPLDLADQIATIIFRVRRLLDLDAEPRAVMSAWKNDDVLGPLSERWPGMRIPGCWDGFEVAVRAILGQQVTVKAGITLATRVVERFGIPLDVADACGEITHVFPTPDILADADLSNMGMTQRRVQTIQTLAAKLAVGEIDLESPHYETLRKQLLAIPGIGPWTFEYIAMRGLHHPDAFPSGDLILQRAVIPGTQLSQKELEQRSQAWRPWRAYAVAYLWRRYGELNS